MILQPSGGIQLYKLQGQFYCEKQLLANDLEQILGSLGNSRILLLISKFLNKKTFLNSTTTTFLLKCIRQNIYQHIKISL